MYRIDIVPRNEGGQWHSKHGNDTPCIERINPCKYIGNDHRRPTHVPQSIFPAVEPFFLLRILVEKI